MSNAIQDAAVIEMRAKVLALEAKMKAMPEHQIEIPIRHFFAPGLYLREMFMPKGACLTGKIHKTEHLCILSEGEVSVQTDYGLKRLKAPSIIHSMPGAKRAIYAHENSTWVNCHHNPTNEQDTDKIERIFVVETFEELESAMKQTQQIEGGK